MYERETRFTRDVDSEMYSRKSLSVDASVVPAAPFALETTESIVMIACAKNIKDSARRKFRYNTAPTPRYAAFSGGVCNTNETKRVKNDALFRVLVGAAADSSGGEAGEESGDGKGTL